MRDALATFADVIVVAPETEQSASSHSLTLHRPMRLRAVEPGVFAIDGTPADCVYVALHSGRVLDRLPDVVVSGLNHGMNLGQDVFYSGTVAAAREGALRGIPSLATSAHPKSDFAVAAATCAKIAAALVGAVSSGGRGAPLLSVNLPKDFHGIRATRLGARIYEELVDFRKDPRGREYFWLGGPGVRHEPDEGTDTEAYDEGVASITPLRLDLTDPSYEDLVTALVAATK
jgi:5'-nucleotidase